MIFLFFCFLLFGSFNLKVIDYDTGKETTTINFGSVSPGEYKNSSQYVEINIDENKQWRLDINTDNNNYYSATKSTPTDGLVFVSSAPIYRAPLLWQVYDSTIPISSLKLDSSTISQWFYVKDKKDDDDWNTSYSSYYTRVAYFDWVDIFIKKYNGEYDGYENATSPFYLYFGADFSGKIPAGIYFTTITFSLSYTADTEIPSLIVDFVPENKIYDKDNILLFKGTAKDNISGIDKVELRWKEEGGVFHSSSTSSENFSFKIGPLNKLTTIYYYIVAYDKVGNWITYSVEESSGYFNQEFSTPTLLSIEILDKLNVSISSGSVKFLDGNAEDGETEVVLPDLGKSINLTIQKIPPPEGAVSSYEIKGSERINKKILIKLLYKDLDNDGIEDTLEVDENTLRIFYYDGFEWRYLGGEVNPEENTVSSYVWHLTKFALFPVTSESSIDWRPKEKIITPYLKDGINDFAQFSISGNFKIYIYTISGTLVRKLENVSVWNGKNDKGEIVESGPYIYKIEKDGKKVFGVITVAK